MWLSNQKLTKSSIGYKAEAKNRIASDCDPFVEDYGASLRDFTIVLQVSEGEGKALCLVPS